MFRYLLCHRRYSYSKRANRIRTPTRIKIRIAKNPKAVHATKSATPLPCPLKWPLLARFRFHAEHENIRSDQCSTLVMKRAKTHPNRRHRVSAAKFRTPLHSTKRISINNCPQLVLRFLPPISTRSMFRYLHLPSAVLVFVFVFVFVLVLETCEPNSHTHTNQNTYRKKPGKQSAQPISNPFAMPSGNGRSLHASVFMRSMNTYVLTNVPHWSSIISKRSDSTRGGYRKAVWRGLQKIPKNEPFRCANRLLRLSPIRQLHCQNDPFKICCRIRHNAFNRLKSIRRSHIRIANNHRNRLKSFRFTCKLLERM